MSGPRALRVMLAGLTLVMLGAALAFGEDAARKAPPDPDPGLLEFLETVDAPEKLQQARVGVGRRLARGILPEGESGTEHHEREPGEHHPERAGSAHQPSLATLPSFSVLAHS